MCWRGWLGKFVICGGHGGHGITMKGAESKMSDVKILSLLA